MTDNGPNNILKFLDYLQYERGYSSYTVSAYKRDLDQFMTFLHNYKYQMYSDFAEIDKQAIRHFISSEYERKDNRPGRKNDPIKPRTIAREIATIKSFFKYLVQAEVISYNPASHIKTPKFEKRIPTFIQTGKIDTLMQMPDETRLIGLRDRAILELFYATGIRLSELVGLNIDSVNTNKNTIKVLGKGNKERIVPFGKPARSALDSYLKKRKISWSAPLKSPLFCARGEKRISVRTVQQRIKIYLKRLLGGKEGSNPHTLRHTFGTHLLDNDADIRSIQELMGHSSTSTTQIYTKVNPQKMKEIYKKSHPHAS
tara:strand:+ start:1234 stop:2175 length:942 start_codon:yes stop_codon:yes gene_type:complete